MIFLVTYRRSRESGNPFAKDQFSVEIDNMDPRFRGDDGAVAGMTVLSRG
jgi:hypothetical protein